MNQPSAVGKAKGGSLRATIHIVKRSDTTVLSLGVGRVGWGEPRSEVWLTALTIIVSFLNFECAYRYITTTNP